MTVALSFSGCPRGPVGSPFSTLKHHWIATGNVTHVFTHFELRLKIYKAHDVEKDIAAGGWWVKVDKLGGEALPTVMKKAIGAAIPDAFARRRN